MKNLYSNLKKLMPIAILVIVLSMLASCSSSNQFASSFSKRKYMTGHYSDPVAKVKTEIGNAVNAITSDNKKAADNNAVTLKKADSKISEPSAIADQKSGNAKAAQPYQASKHSSQKNVANKIAAATADNKNVTTVEKNSSIYSSPDSTEKTTSDGGHHHYLALFFLCLLLALLFLILAAGSAVAGSAGGLGLFAILSYVMWLAAIIFLVLFIISLFA
jgi:hypothetical protein